MMRTPEKDLAFLYFENKSVVPEISGFIPASKYLLLWLSPATGVWIKYINILSDKNGEISIPAFPDRQHPSITDRAAKITLK
jgi:hypothetical protein